MKLHGDERAALQAALLSAVPAVGLRLVAPDLHVINPATRRFEPAPPASLALRSGESTPPASLALEYFDPPPPPGWPSGLFKVYRKGIRSPV